MIAVSRNIQEITHNGQYFIYIIIYQAITRSLLAHRLILRKTKCGNSSPLLRNCRLQKLKIRNKDEKNFGDLY
jgi:hypothetical protein